MSIKEELEKLRKEQEKLEQKIEKENDKKESEMSSLQQAEQRLIQFEGKKSEIAKKIYEELYQEIKECKDYIKSIEDKIEEYQNECLPIKSRIDELSYDTSFYIKEQVNYLILEFMSYVERNEMQLGKNILTEFRIKPCIYYSGKVPYHCRKPDGCFELEQDDEKFVFARTKNYYFNNRIVVRYTDGDCILSDWYQKYENNFITSFLESLKSNFHSENFKVVDVDNRGIFTIELI